MLQNGSQNSNSLPRDSWLFILDSGVNDAGRCTGQKVFNIDTGSVLWRQTEHSWGRSQCSEAVWTGFLAQLRQASWGLAVYFVLHFIFKFRGVSYANHEFLVAIAWYVIIICKFIGFTTEQLVQPSKNTVDAVTVVLWLHQDQNWQLVHHWIIMACLACPTLQIYVRYHNYFITRLFLYSI